MSFCRGADTPAAARAAITTVKQLPAPGRLVTSIRPPCCSTICWTMDSPIPVPASPDSSAFFVR